MALYTVRFDARVPSSRFVGFYEKVINVKADVAAVLVRRQTLDWPGRFTAF